VSTATQNSKLKTQNSKLITQARYLPGFTVTLAIPVAEYVPLVAEASTTWVANAALVGTAFVMETDSDEPAGMFTGF
jgi:hypothetical protein